VSAERGAPHLSSSAACPPLDLTPPALCADANLVVEDSKGVPYDEAHVRVSRVPLTMAPVGRRIAKTLAQNPRGPEQHEAAQAQPGCRLTGAMRVKKVAGDFHVAATRQLVNMDGHFGYTIPPDVLASFNASHTIHALSFGPSFPGQVNPLTGYEPASPAKGPNMWQYHIRVVPTLYTYLYGSIVESEQYSASDFVTTGGEGGMNVHPGVWWRFDFSPIMVRKAETRRSILQFLTSMFAILGGVYALSGIIDTVVWRTVDSAKVK